MTGIAERFREFVLTEKESNVTIVCILTKNEMAYGKSVFTEEYHMQKGHKQEKGEEKWQLKIWGLK